MTKWKGDDEVGTATVRASREEKEKGNTVH